MVQVKRAQKKQQVTLRMRMNQMTMILTQMADLSPVMRMRMMMMIPIMTMMKMYFTCITQFNYK